MKFPNAFDCCGGPLAWPDVCVGSSRCAALVLGGLIVTVTTGLLAYAAVPWVVRQVATEQVQAQLGRGVSIGDIRFQPWALALEVDDLALMGPTPTAQPLVKMAHLRLNLSAASVWRRAPVVESLQLEGGPQAHAHPCRALRRGRHPPALARAASSGRCATPALCRLQPERQWA
ncbi:hypothetical protein ACFSUG_06025 [Ideonella paludis]|uniref:DUF748 domain-containing protein n=1 Tax=Ideonella paludis TaxID=1233411 RepID=UPI003644DF95